MNILVDELIDQMMNTKSSIVYFTTSFINFLALVTSTISVSGHECGCGDQVPGPLPRLRGPGRVSGPQARALALAPAALARR